MERRKFLEKFGWGAAGAGMLAAAYNPADAAAPGPTPDRNSFRAADFGVTGDGKTDDTAAIQRAIDAAQKLGGGTVYLEGTGGRNFKCGGQLSLDDMRGVHLVGSSGPAAAATTQLNYSGTSAPFISLRSCNAITFEGLKISYSNPAFKGSLVTTGHSTAKADPAYLLFHRCRFVGYGASNADHLLNLRLAICSTVRNCEFQGSQVGIIGADGVYSNVIQITDCAFREQDKVAIQNAGESWLISGCTFEPLADGKAGAYHQSAYYSYGLTFLGCWMGDVSKPGGCWIDLSDGSALGLTIVGNRMGSAGPGSTDAAIKIGAKNEGVAISGNRIEGTIGIDFTSPYIFGAAITGNDLQCSKPIANLERVMSHFVAGHYTTQNHLSGVSNFGMGIFSGDGGTRGSIQLLPQPPGSPTTPQNGDMWMSGSDIFVRVNGVSKKIALI